MTASLLLFESPTRALTNAIYIINTRGIWAMVGKNLLWDHWSTDLILVSSMMLRACVDFFMAECKWSFQLIVQALRVGGGDISLSIGEEIEDYYLYGGVNIGSGKLEMELLWSFLVLPM